VLKRKASELPRNLPPLVLALLFISAAVLWASWVEPSFSTSPLLLLAAAAAGYMALNIGANDVANNVGPAVGANALTMGTALLLAATFDVAGAVLAGNRVIDTVAHDLLTLEEGVDPAPIIGVMVAAMLAAAAWINLSTFLGTPVSTTHAIIGGVVGAGIAAAGPAAVEWNTIGVIALSWTLSPLLGAALAAAAHALIRKLITRRRDKLGAARRWVPVFCGLMAGIFAAYLTLLVQQGAPSTLVLALAIAAGILGWAVSLPWVWQRSRKLENRKKQVARLFRPALVFAAAMLSFAHGANDVANALGPLVAILSVVGLHPGQFAAATAPGWAVLTGALGLGAGILLFGPRVIHTVGDQITKLNEIRAFCVALAAAITVLAASGLGLPLSSTHVAVGAVFGVGFLREYLAIRNMRNAVVPIEAHFLDPGLLNDTPQQAIARERRYKRRFLVRRFKVARIGAAWLITLPAAAGLGALAYLALVAFTLG
jgi:PiT family inorganic phosphate transporter